MHVIYLREEDSNPGKTDSCPRKEEASVLELDKYAGCSDESNMKIQSEESSNEAVFACEFCNENFDEESELREHYSVHIDINSYSCGACQKTFSQESAMLSHSCYLPKVPKSCNICHKKFRSDKSLKKHYTFHTRDRPFKCKICDKSFIREYNLNQHYTLNKCKIYTCFVCGISFSQANHLREHEKTHSEIHDSEKASERTHDPTKPFVCDVCGKCFRIKHLLKIHYPIHTGERAFACSDCDLRFTAERTLHLHYRRFHVGIRPFVCDVCGKAFLFKRELNAHYYKHTGGRPFKCKDCGTGFCHNKSLTRHIRLGICPAHIPGKKRAKERNCMMIVTPNTHESKIKSEQSDDEYFGGDTMDYTSSTSDQDFIKKEHIDEIFICDLCNQHFDEKEDLHNHYVIHAPELETVKKKKPHQCKSCNKRFRLKISLQKHSCFLALVKDNACSACKKNFNNESELKNHSCPKKLPKIFTCNMCSKSFFDETKFNEHYCPQADDRPFVCKVCGRAFHLEDTLKRHHLIHEGVNLELLWENYVLDRKSGTQKNSFESGSVPMDDENE